MTEYTLQPGESITIRAATSTSPPTEPPTEPPVPPTEPPVPPNVSLQGDLQFNGVRFDTTGISDNIAAFRIVIPVGFSGQQTMLSVFENGNPMRWRHCVLSRTMGDLSGSSPYAAGANGGANLYIAFGYHTDDKVTVQPNEVWWLNVRNEFYSPFSTAPYPPTCPPGENGNFGVKLYPPS